MNLEQKKQLNPDSATKLSVKQNDSIQELKAEQELDQTDAARTTDEGKNDAINIQLPAETS